MAKSPPTRSPKVRESSSSKYFEASLCELVSIGGASCGLEHIFRHNFYNLRRRPRVNRPQSFKSNASLL